MTTSQKILKQVEAIPRNHWCTGDYDSGKLKHCYIGHAMIGNIDRELVAELVTAMNNVTNSNTPLYSPDMQISINVNDGILGNPYLIELANKYKHPKTRIKAWLRDLIKLGY